MTHSAWHSAELELTGTFLAGDASINHITQIGGTKLLPTKAAAAGISKPHQV